MKKKTCISSHIEKELSDRLEDYRSKLRPIPSVSDVLREALILFLNLKETT